MDILIRDIPEEVKNKLVKLAKAEDRSLSSYIRQLLKKEVQNNENNHHDGRSNDIADYLFGPDDSG